MTGSSSIVLMKLFTFREKTIENRHKILVIRIHENRDGKIINTKDMKEPKLTKYRISICKIVSFCLKLHYVLASAKRKYNLD